MILVTPPHIRWVVDARKTIVINEQTGEAHLLTGIEAAVWSWLSLAYPYSKLVSMMTAFLRCEDAELRLNDLLQSWYAAGILEDSDHG